jgi:probable HAF family extracellular repeat protein
MRKLALATALALVGVVQAAAALPSFTSLPTGVTWNVLSADGSTVVGTGNVSGIGQMPFRWRAANPLVASPYPFDPADFNERGTGTAVSADGTVVGGHTQFNFLALDGDHPTRCSSASSCIPTFSSSGMFDSTGQVLDLSSDAGYAVGDSFFFEVSNGDHYTAAYWGPTGTATTMTPYAPADVGGHITISQGTAVSGNGAVAAGWTLVPTANPFAPTTQAFLWTPGGGFQLIGDLPGGAVQSSAEDISNDGSTVVGGSSSTLGNQAYYWTAGSGMVALGDLAGGSFNSRANGANANGSIIVGFASTGAGATAFIWDPVNGMRSLYDVLVAAGVTGLAGWNLTNALGVSDDGNTFFGFGTNPSGQSRYWVAVIPEPGTAALLGLGVVLLAVRRGRARA